MRKKSNNKMVIISLRMPKKWLDIIDRFEVLQGRV